MKKEKKILDVTYGSRTIWFDKEHPNAIYTDKRREFHEGPNGRTCYVDPDIIADFTNLPFEDESFHLVVFDPPHLIKLGENAWLAKKYGKLLPDWETDIRGGFEEYMRVLKPNGVLIFKWNERDIKAKKVLQVIRMDPLFGHTTGSNSQTIWMTFMKL
jgi:SAM-dependent methyltransferase